MTPLDEVFEKIKELSVEDLSVLLPHIQEELRKKAGDELTRREEELNELRVMAGMKRRPRSRKPPESGKKRRVGRPPKEPSAAT